MLPRGWSQHESRSRPGKLYYVNDKTGEKTWEVPTDEAVGDSDEVQVSHLLVKHRNSRRPASWRTGEQPITITKEEAIAKLQDFRQQCVSAMNESAGALSRVFAQLASVESDCSSAKRGGDLGPFGRGQMQKPFEDCAFSLKVGQLSGIVDTDSGVHILLRTA